MNDGLAWAIPGGGEGGSVEAGLLFRPRETGTLLVAAALAVAVWLVLERGGVAPRSLLPERLAGYGGWALAAVFILRGIGDFRWVGLFKTRRGTLFARWDTLLYSPLCLLIGVGAIVIIRTGGGTG